MAVDRCICHRITIADALVVARRHGIATVAALQAHLPVGTGCGLCIPYMQCALVTGAVDLPIFDEQTTAAWVARSGTIPTPSDGRSTGGGT